MLKERRNCFLGRCKGFEGLRTWPTMGDPLFLECPVKPEMDCLNLGGPIGSGAGECADCGRFSLWGEDSKHSWADIRDEGAVGPLPNLNGGHSTRADFNDTDVVVILFVLDTDGLIKVGLRRLLERSC